MGLGKRTITIAEFELRTSYIISELKQKLTI